MGMTTTLTARDLSDANYPEFVAWVQDILQACWSVAGKNFKPLFELQDSRIFEVVNALSLGHTRSVIAESISGPEWTQQCHASLKKTTREKGKLDEFKASSKESGKAFEKKAPASISPEFLYAIGNVDVWQLLELVMMRYLGNNVSSILEATFNREKKPGEMKSSDLYYRVQEMNLGKKFLPGGKNTIPTPDFIVWTGVLFNHATKTQEKLKEFNLFEKVPTSTSCRAIELRQIETLDSMCYSAYKASKSDNKPKQKSGKRNRDVRQTSNKKRLKIKCNFCQRLGHTECALVWPQSPAVAYFCILYY